MREWNVRAGTIEPAIPKLRTGSYFPSFLEPRRRAEAALASVMDLALEGGADVAARVFRCLAVVVQASTR